MPPDVVPPTNQTNTTTDLRNKFAGDALKGILAAMTPSDAYETADPDRVAHRAYCYAESMIACSKRYQT